RSQRRSPVGLSQTRALTRATSSTRSSARGGPWIPFAGCCLRTCSADRAATPDRVPAETDRDCCEVAEVRERVRQAGRDRHVADEQCEITELHATGEQVHGESGDREEAV